MASVPAGTTRAREAAMTGSVAAVVVIPIVVAIALFGWIAAVLYANAHPHYKHQSNLPRTEVAGGAFQALDGGRQLMPIHGTSNAWPDGRLVQPGEIPEPRTAVSGEELAAATGQQQHGAREATVGAPAEQERHLVPGTRLRLVPAFAWAARAALCPAPGCAWALPCLGGS